VPWKKDLFGGTLRPPFAMLLGDSLGEVELLDDNGQVP
jgi:hypothetical protein